MKMEVLKLIQKQDGKWTWYQIERALSNHAEAKNGLLMDMLSQLEGSGLIRSESI